MCIRWWNYKVFKNARYYYQSNETSILQIKTVKNIAFNVTTLMTKYLQMTREFIMDLLCASTHLLDQRHEYNQYTQPASTGLKVGR